MAHERIDFLGLPLDTGLTTDSICAMLDQKGKTRLIGYISPSSWADARKYQGYTDALRKMDVVRAGGQGVATACSWITGKPCPRISFDMTSMAKPFFKKVMKERATLVLVGGKPGVEEQMQEKLVQQFKDLKVLGAIHGYGDFDPKINFIKEKKPDAVLAGMGTPRQELFLVALKEAGYKGFAISCGGFFDQYLEADNYYPEWIDKLNLRFLWRLSKEPVRLWKRYLVDYQLFVFKASDTLGRKYYKLLEKELKKIQQELKRAKEIIRKKTKKPG